MPDICQCVFLLVLSLSVCQSRCLIPDSISVFLSDIYRFVFLLGCMPQHVNIFFTESAPRPIQSESQHVCLYVCLSPPSEIYFQASHWLFFNYHLTFTFYRSDRGGSVSSVSSSGPAAVLSLGSLFNYHLTYTFYRSDRGGSVSSVSSSSPAAVLSLGSF